MPVHKILIILLLLFIPLYPKFPLLGVGGTFVAVRLEDILVLLISLICFFNLAKGSFRNLSRPIPRAIILYWLVGLAAVFSGIFLTKTADFKLGLLHAFRQVEYMVLFFAGWEFIKSRSDIRFVVRLLIVISLIIAVYGLGQMYFHFPIISTTNSEFSKGLALSLGPGARINSTFAGHYDLAAFSAFPLLLIMALLPISKNRSLLLLIWGLIYWMLLMSASRATFVSFFVSAALLLIVIRRRMLLIPLGFLALLGVLISPQLRGRYLQFFTNHFNFSYISPVSAQITPIDAVPDALIAPSEPEDRSFNIRWQVEWPRAVRSFFKNPLLGTGFSSVGLAVDSQYLRILAETGLLGLFAFALIFIRLGRSYLPDVLHYQPSVESAFVVSCAMFVISLGLGGVLIDVFAASKIALFTWLIIGISDKIKSL